jgi:hypothetical protein
LLQGGADVNALDDHGWAPLHVAAGAGVVARGENKSRWVEHARLPHGLEWIQIEHFVQTS